MQGGLDTSTYNNLERPQIKNWNPKKTVTPLGWFSYKRGRRRTGAWAQSMEGAHSEHVQLSLGGRGLTELYM